MNKIYGVILIALTTAIFVAYIKRKGRKKEEDAFDPYSLRNLSMTGSAPFVSRRSPNTKDYNYNVGQYWINKKEVHIFILERKANLIAYWVEIDFSDSYWDEE